MRNILYGFITCILFAVIALGAYTFGKQQARGSVESKTSSEKVILTQAPKLTPSIREKRENYVHPEAGYSLSYPSSLLIKENVIPNSDCGKEFIVSRKEIGFPESYQGEIVLEVCPLASEFFPRAILDNVEGNQEQPSVLDGKEGYVKSGKVTFYKTDGTTVNVIRYAFYVSGSYYSLEYRYATEDSKMKATFYDILSTFKFNK